MKFNKFIFAASFVLIASNLLAQPLADAMKLLEMKQYAKAKTAFLANLKVRNSASDWYFLGKIYSSERNSDSANMCFSNIAIADSKSSLTIIAQAVNEVLWGNKTQALITLEKAKKAATSSKDIYALTEIALLRYQAGDITDWMSVLDVATGIDRKNPRPYVIAGNIYRQLSEQFPKKQFLGLAAGRYEQALYYSSDNAEALTGQAGLYILGQNYSEAEKYLDKVISKDSNYIPALRINGELAYSLGKYEKASLLYGRYIALSEFVDKDVSRYITILYFNKEYAKANELITPFLAKEPSNAVMLRLQGYTSYELDKNQEGLEAMKKFFEVRAETDTNKIIPDDYEYTGKLYSRMGNDSLSIIFLRKAIEMDSTKDNLFEDIAKIYEKQKNQLMAIECYENFIASKRGDVASAIYFKLGKALYMIANDVASTSDSLSRPVYLQGADTAFVKVIEMSPNSYLGYLWHARVAAALDPETLQGLAKPDYEKALSILEQKPDKVKYKSDLIEGYRYMGYFTYLQFDAAKTAKDEALKEQLKTLSFNYWQQVLDIDPENDVAKQAIKALK